MKPTTIMAIITTSSSALEVPIAYKHQEYMNFLSTQNKSYRGLRDFEQHFEAWTATDNFIQSYAGVDILLAHNKFSDLTQAERSMRLGKNTDAPLPDFESDPDEAALHS